jgi:hypothetical protein
MDKIFKIGLLVLGFSYLAYLFCPIANQTGRYQYHEDSDSISVIDTITGLVYRSEGKGEGELDLVAWAKGQMELIKGFEKLESKEFIEKMRKEGIKIEETN